MIVIEDFLFSKEIPFCVHFLAYNRAAVYQCNIANELVERIKTLVIFPGILETTLSYVIDKSQLQSTLSKQLTEYNVELPAYPGGVHKWIHKISQPVNYLNLFKMGFGPRKQFCQKVKLKLNLKNLC